MAYAALAEGRAPWLTGRHLFFNSLVRPRFAGRGGCGNLSELHFDARYWMLHAG
jgi:hypothetical protein